VHRPVEGHQLAQVPRPRGLLLDPPVPAHWQSAGRRA
jgi:hypothetical protein